MEERGRVKRYVCVRTLETRRQLKKGQSVRKWERQEMVNETSTITISEHHNLHMNCMYAHSYVCTHALCIMWWPDTQVPLWVTYCMYVRTSASSPPPEWINPDGLGTGLGTYVCILYVHAYMHAGHVGSTNVHPISFILLRRKLRRIVANVADVPTLAKKVFKITWSA